MTLKILGHKVKHQTLHASGGMKLGSKGFRAPVTLLLSKSFSLMQAQATHTPLGKPLPFFPG